MKRLVNLFLLLVFLLATINLALASEGVVGMVILDSPSQEKNVVLEEDSNSQVQLTQVELKEQYEQQELENDLVQENFVDEKITGASVIDLEDQDSRATIIFIVIILIILFLFALVMWLSFR